MIDIRQYFPDLPDDAVIYECSPTFVAALTSVRERECTMCYVSTGRVTRAAIVALWSKPFLELGLLAVHGYTPEANEKAMQFARSLGGIRGARPCAPGHTHWVMLRKKCKWLLENNA